MTQIRLIRKFQAHVQVTTMKLHNCGNEKSISTNYHRHGKKTQRKRNRIKVIDTKMSAHKAYNPLASDFCVVGLYSIDLYFRSFPFHMSSVSRVITNKGGECH